MAASGSSMRQWICLLTLLYSLAVTILPVNSQTQVQVCEPNPPEGRRVNCGPPGISQDVCENENGCCWDPSLTGVPWCYRRQFPSCPLIPVGDRIDCASGGVSPTECHDRNCCWDSGTASVPHCFHDRPDTCIVQDADKADCGFAGITQFQCEQATTIYPACCYLPTSPTGVPACFFPLGTVTTVPTECLALPPGLAGTNPLCFPNDPTATISSDLCFYHGCCIDPTDLLCYDRNPFTTTTSTTTTTVTTPIDVCAITNGARNDCGYSGITSTNCEAGEKCCFDSSPAVTQCYYDITVTLPIGEPSECPSTVMNTNTDCAADPDPQITEDKCNLVGCCWDPAATGGRSCYTPPESTTTATTTTTTPTTTEATTKKKKVPTATLR